MSSESALAFCGVGRNNSAVPSDFPVRLQSPSGLSIEVNANGSIRRIDCGDVLLNLFLGTEIEGGPANLYLRRHTDGIEAIPLLGPRTPGRIRVGNQGLSVDGEWNGIGFSVWLALARSAPAWFWHVELENRSAAAQTVDLVYLQDVGLTHYGMVRFNEYYVSQYVDHTPLAHPGNGAVLAVRQSMSVGGRHPWALLGALGNAVSFATDALQIHGLETRAGDATPAGLLAEALPGKRLQHEHSMAALQDARVCLQPRERSRRGFFGWFEADHPAPSSAADLTAVDKALTLPEARAPREREPLEAGPPAAATRFSAEPLVASLDLGAADIATLFGKDLRHVEQEGGDTLSFFTGSDRHVVLKAKERKVLRPHGHILRTGDRLVPDESSLTTTAWMAGVFNSQLTQGHVSINRFLSTSHGYLSMLRACGQRIFVELAGRYHLLDVPSAFEMSPSGCRWVYKHAGGLLEVRSWACVNRHELNLSVEAVTGGPCRFLISNHIAINGDDGALASPVTFNHEGSAVVVRPLADSEIGRRFPQGSFRIQAENGAVLERVGGDELLFADGRARNQPFLVLETAPATTIALRITGHLVSPVPDVPAARAPSADRLTDERGADRFWDELSGAREMVAPGRSALAEGVARLAEIEPWLVHNAMIHYLAPRGLEQYSGGGWGTRDVCQGPVELMLALGRWEPVRDLLLRVFKAQNPDGDWPQWFTFFERDRGMRAGDSHGDIVFWPLLALAEYVKACEDASILGEKVPFFDLRGDRHAEYATVADHVARALGLIERRVIPGTVLAAYGHGDWDDSLQPADPAMRQRLCSSWTVTLQVQALGALAEAWRRIGRAGESARLEESAERVRADFQCLLIADNVVAGFAYFHEDGRVEHWLHPRDAAAGIRYRLLPMIHGIIAGLFTPAHAAAHVGYIRQHLLGADGARLFDRPLVYRGGLQRRFQRAESSSYFGREIGLMYMHAHLRYAEAMACYGDAEAFFLALRQANPIDVRSAVPAARPRQANCYTTSSDGALADRYEAEARYEELKRGDIPVEGGWRIYSSGAGIAMRLIQQCFLGLRRGRSTLVIDPVVPRALDGLCARVELAGRMVDLVYRVAGRGCGPTALSVNDVPLAFVRQPNPYRTGGAAVPMASLEALLREGTNTLTVNLG